MQFLDSLSEMPRRTQKKLAMLATALMVGVLGHGLAAAQTVPTMSCSTSSRINTGTDQTGALAPLNTPDPYWQYTAVGSTEQNTLVPKLATDWLPATVVPPSAPPWVWQTYPNANWISISPNRDGYARTYYRYRFNLDPGTQPADFGLGVHFHVDDQVLAVFVNGAKQDGVVIGGGWTSPPAPQYTIPGEFSLNTGWQAGLNEVVVLVQNFGGSTLSNPTPLGGLLVRGVSACGGAQIAKQFAPAAVNPGDVSNLTITVTNRTDPAVAVSDVRFVDTLPSPLVLAGAPVTNTCGGTVTGGSGDQTLELTGGSLPAGTTGNPGSCAVTVPVRWPTTAVAQCTGAAVTNTITPGRAVTLGQFSTALGQVNTPASANLVCAPAVASLQVTVSVAPAAVNMVGQSIPFTASCQSPVQNLNGAVVLGAGNTGVVTLPVAAGSTNCTLAVSPAAVAPAGYQWVLSGPAYTQPNPAAAAAGAIVPGAIALTLMAEPAAVPLGGGAAFWTLLLLMAGLAVLTLRRAR